MRIITAKPDWNRRCWVVALEQTCGITEAECEHWARRCGWNGNTSSITIDCLYRILQNVLKLKPTLDLPNNPKAPRPKPITPRDYFVGKGGYLSRSSGKGFGMVCTDRHVMPYQNGHTSNFNGFGDDPILLVMRW